MSNMIMIICYGDIIRIICMANKKKKKKGKRAQALMQAYVGLDVDGLIYMTMFFVPYTFLYT